MTRLETFVEAVHATLAQPSVVAVVHRKEQTEHKAPRRIEWRALTGIVGPPKPGRAGQVKVGQATSSVAPYDRFEQVGALIVAENIDVLDALFDQFVVAVQLTLGRTFPMNYKWETEEDGKNAHNARGCAVRCVFEVGFPVREVQSTLTAVASTTLNYEIDAG